SGRACRPRAPARRPPPPICRAVRDGSPSPPPHPNPPPQGRAIACGILPVFFVPARVCSSLPPPTPTRPRKGGGGSSSAASAPAPSTGGGGGGGGRRGGIVNMRICDSPAPQGGRGFDRAVLLLPPPRRGREGMRGWRGRGHEDGHRRPPRRRARVAPSLALAAGGGDPSVAGPVLRLRPGALCVAAEPEDPPRLARRPGRGPSAPGAPRLYAGLHRDRGPVLAGCHGADLGGRLAVWAMVGDDGHGRRGHHGRHPALPGRANGCWRQPTAARRTLAKAFQGGIPGQCFQLPPVPAAGAAVSL